MQDAIALLTTITAERLRRDRLLTRKVTVWLETEYREGTAPELSNRVTDLPVPVSDARLLTVFTCGAVDELYRPSARYRAAGVYCEELTVDDAAVAPELDHAGRRTARPYGAVNRVTGRYPRWHDIVQPSQSVNARHLTSEVEPARHPAHCARRHVPYLTRSVYCIS
jgi:hypothetical protein